MSKIEFSLKEAWKIIILVIGVSVAIVGIAFLVLPGPGLPIIVLGLVILGTEFVWARKLLRKTKSEYKMVERSATRELKKLT